MCLKGKHFKEVARVPICMEEGKKYQVEIVGNEVVISKEVAVAGWENITSKCHLDFRKSKHNGGFYIAIMYRTVQAVIIGMKGIQPQYGFKIEKAPLATTSFRVSMKVR